MRVIGKNVCVDGIRGYHTTHRPAPYFTRVLEVNRTGRNRRTVLALADLLRQAPSSAARRKP